MVTNLKLWKDTTLRLFGNIFLQFPPSWKGGENRIGTRPMYIEFTFPLCKFLFKSVQQFFCDSMRHTDRQALSHVFILEKRYENKKTMTIYIYFQNSSSVFNAFFAMCFCRGSFVTIGNLTNSIFNRFGQAMHISLLNYVVSYSKVVIFHYKIEKSYYDVRLNSEAFQTNLNSKLIFAFCLLSLLSERFQKYSYLLWQSL